MQQAEDRAHRIGQHDSVTVQYLVAGGTLDDSLFKSLERKALNTSAILNGRQCGLAATCQSRASAAAQAAPAGQHSARRRQSSSGGDCGEEESLAQPAKRLCIEVV